MNKSEARAMATLRQHLALGHRETAARSIWNLIRAARTTRSAVELRAIAQELNLANPVAHLCP